MDIPGSKRRICDEFSNHSLNDEMKVTKSGPNIKLREYEQQLELAETTCGSLKSQLDYMKLLCQVETDMQQTQDETNISEKANDISQEEELSHKKSTTKYQATDLQHFSEEHFDSDNINNYDFHEDLQKIQQMTNNNEIETKKYESCKNPKIPNASSKITIYPNIEKIYEGFILEREEREEKDVEDTLFLCFRDGVSEGELTKVMCYELKAIQNAFLSLEKDGKYNPPITFLVVQKRHHVRLFPTNRKDSDDRNYNVQAGTIVDTHITHPSQIDFYLVSHASIQGTARPTKYRCIWNDNKLTEDEIEELTYYLCHMFSRCTRSVSYPAPTYYAHLAAFRARALIYNQFIDMDNLRKEQNKIALKMDMKEAPMFFI